jgi:hypothetical protein
MAGSGLNTTNLANAWLNVLGGTTFTGITNVYVQLHTGDPGSGGTTNISVGSTTRVVMALAAASGGSISLTGTQPVWTNGGTSETLTGITVWSAITAGNHLLTADLTSTQAWASTNTFTLNSFSVSLSPLAS